MLKVKVFNFNDLQERCSVVWDETGECAIIDPGYAYGHEKEALEDFIAENKLHPVKILLTHGHFDHTLGLRQCKKKYNIPVYMHPDDIPILKGNEFFRKTYGMQIPDTDVETIDIKDGDRISVGNTEFEVIATPGHTMGCVCFLDARDKILFSGDTLFAGAIGRTDHPGGDYDKLMESIFSRLMTLDGDIDVIPGHGPGTTIADERTKNPFLMPFNIPIDEMEQGQ